MTGYGSASYAASLAHLGLPRQLPRSGGWVLVRDVPGTPYRDAIGPYPLLACPDWSPIAEDLAELDEELVTLAVVTDPFGNWTVDGLRRAFPDLVAPFKQHVVVDLSNPSVSRHHQREAARANKSVRVEPISDPSTFVDDWTTLYDALRVRHQIRGPAAFPRASFVAQLDAPGLVAFRAVHDDELVGANLWYRSDRIGYLHLSASTDLGYSLSASFALMEHALGHFAASGLDWLSLGGGAGLRDEPSDGLSRFKRGWSSETRTAYLCGRILAPDVYTDLVGGSTVGSFFPAYRNQ